MIAFDLRCVGGHVFEAWFASSAAYEEQRARGLLVCPVCGDSDVVKAVMAPRVSAKSNQLPASEQAARRLRTALAEIAACQARALEKSRWVGRDFANEARAIHEGVSRDTVVHGQATPEEARALIEDGVGVMPLLVPIAPPDAVN